MLAVASALWPALVAVVVVALRTPNPTRILAFFLAGSMLTTVSIGLAIVFTVESSSIVTGARRPADAALDLTVGALALIAGFVISRRAPRRAAERDGRTEAERPGWSQRMVSRGAGLAFVVGIALNVVPGLFPFVALKDIAQLDYAAWTTVALVVGFYVIMFTLVEVPLVAGIVAPAPTAAAVDRFNRWLSRNGRLLIVVALEVVGIYLVVRGIVAAVG